MLTSFVGSNEGGFDGEDVGSTPVIKLRQKLPSPVENIGIDMRIRANNVQPIANIRYRLLT